MNVGVHVSFWIMVFLGYMSSSGISGSYGSFIPRFLRTLYIFLHSGSISLHSYQWCQRVPFPPHVSTSLALFRRLFADGHSDRWRWYLIVVLIFVSLIMSDVEHLFMCLLAICMSSLEKCLLSSLAHFLIGLFIFQVLSCMSSILCILEINSLSVMSFAIIYSHSEGCLFTLLIVFFIVQKVLNLIRSHLFIFAFISNILGGGS